MSNTSDDIPIASTNPDSLHQPFSLLITNRCNRNPLLAPYDGYGHTCASVGVAINRLIYVGCAPRNSQNAFGASMENLQAVALAL